MVGVRRPPEQHLLSRTQLGTWPASLPGGSEATGEGPAGFLDLV